MYVLTDMVKKNLSDRDNFLEQKESTYNKKKLKVFGGLNEKNVTTDAMAFFNNQFEKFKQNNMRDYKACDFTQKFQDYC